MVKRERESDLTGEKRAEKRARPAFPDRLSSLSDELILRVLSYLTVPELVVCQRLSRKYHGLAGDGQLWKAHYYDRFVKPRANRLPNRKDLTPEDTAQYLASKTARWLDDGHLVKGGGRTIWKRQYKLKHNWSKGTCAVNEIEVAEHAPIPPVLVQMHEGIIYMADRLEGLRAWSAKTDRKLVAQGPLIAKPDAVPTAMAVEFQEDVDDKSRIILGFHDGSFSVYLLDLANAKFVHRYSHARFKNGVVSAVAVSWPYVCTMTATQQLSVYRFEELPNLASDQKILKEPVLLHSLRSQTIWPPLSVSLRPSDTSIVVTLAYSQPSYLSGWTVGIQEVWIDRDGQLLDSRVTSAIDEHYRSLAFVVPPMRHHLRPPTSWPLGPITGREFRQIHSKPTSLSYTHPYLLVSHPDNTLTLYLVRSTATTLSITSGTRLWGHTSSVSGAHVGCRGKAVSVSRRGDELRLWELEGGFASSFAQRRLATGNLSVKVKAETHPVARLSHDLNQNTAALHSVTPDDSETSDLTLTRGWIGFDEEHVVVLKEHSQGRQALIVYDFT